MNLVCLVPQVVTGSFSEQLFVGGTSLLIVVGVALETVRQVSAQLATQRYDSLLFSDENPELPNLGTILSGARREGFCFSGRPGCW